MSAFSEKQINGRREAVKRYRERHPDKVRENCKRNYASRKARGVLRQTPYSPNGHLMRTYGISIAERDAMMALHGGCEICGDSTEKPYVDHNHTTGAVRGILCRHCNTLIGDAKESIRVLLSAADYLEKYNGPTI